MIDAGGSHGSAELFPQAPLRAAAEFLAASAFSGNGWRAVPWPCAQGCRLFSRFTILATVGFLAAWVTAATSAVAQEEETEGITGYVACLDAAVRRIDDGRPDVAAIAAAAVGACAARFPEPIPGKVSAAAQKKYARRVQTRQMELGVMVVQDLRGQP
jgi:hypothetical protein